MARGRQIRASIVLATLMAVPLCFTGPVAPRTRGTAMMAETAVSSSSGSSGSSSVALVKVTKENSIATAGVLGGVTGLLLGGFWIGAAGFAVASFGDRNLFRTVEGDDEFSERPEMADDMVNRLQALVTETYSDVTARDRQRHSGSWMVPKDFTVVAAWRNENSKLWRKYCVKKAELKQEAKESPFEIYSDVRTTKVWEMHGDQLDPSINEWYLWHGTSSSAALNICQSDFKMRLAGSATGTLYGRGSYFAESVTKADEYSKEEDGLYTVLLCRVLGGRVKYTADRTPDPDALTRECTQGESDCILGDRIKISGTYREFIVFDTELVYPEYIIKYKRGELFKSPSHP